MQEQLPKLLSSADELNETYEEIPRYSSGGFFFLVRPFIKFTGVFAFASILATLSLLSYDFVRAQKAFPPKTFIGYVDVSNLSKEEAIAKLKDTPLTESFVPLLTLEADYTVFSFPPEELGAYILYEETVNNAFRITHKGGYLEELKERLFTEAAYAPLILGIDGDQLKRILAEVAAEIRSTPKDASIIFYEETGSYHIEPEDVGREVNISKSMDDFKTALYRGEISIPLAIHYAYPEIREKDLRAFPPVYRLSAYTTYYGKHDSKNRIHNIKLIASWIDGTLLMPEETYSLADTIGEFTPERGFKEAFVIYGGVLVPMFGGGTCQIGTTFFNAVALADIKVLERSNHSFYFNIYPLGRDATVYPGQKDFRFQNDTGHPILIKTIATNKRLSFRIYGTPTGKKVEFSPAAVWGKAKGGNYVPMSLGQVIAWDVPFKTSITRTVYDQDGNKLKEETIHSSYKLYGEKTNVPIARPEPR